MTQQALVLEGVVKRFGAFTAVDGLSFAVSPGEVFGFLGGNGAGKTTSLRMVLDILRPDAGRIAVLGAAPGRANSARLGFLPEERGLYRRMSALDTVVYFGRLKGMPPADARREGTRLLERFGLGDFLKTSVDKLSKGMAQKVQLATAVVNTPALLLLDEPFSGLDPVNQQLLEDEIREAARRGAAVVFSTHVMQHAERLCDRLLLLARGRKRFEGTQEQARATLPAQLIVTAQASPEGFDPVAGAHGAPLDGGWSDWAVTLHPGRTPAELLQRMSEAGIGLRRFEERRPSLHDVFLHIVGQAEARA